MLKHANAMCNFSAYLVTAYIIFPAIINPFTTTTKIYALLLRYTSERIVVAVLHVLVKFGYMTDSTSQSTANYSITF
jgi:hypothetical protein